MSETGAVTLLKRHARLKQKQDLCRPQWQELADYIVPRKSNISVRRTPGTKLDTEKYDSTAPRSAELLASSMQGSLTPGQLMWFRLKMRDQMLNLDRNVGVWLDDTRDRLSLGLRQSNFAAEMQEVYLDLGTFGIGCLFVEEKEGDDPFFNGFQLKALAVGEYVIAENAEGRVDTVMREFELTAGAAVQKWGKNVGPKIAQIAEKDPDQMVKILHAVYPRVLAQYSKTPKSRKFASCYVSMEDKSLLEEGGYYELPYMVPRWTKTSSTGEYGYGPGHTALPDIRTLNKAKEMGLEAWAIDLRPPMEVVDDGVIGSVRWTPAALNTVREAGSIKPITTGAKYDVDQIKSEDLRRSIQQIFFYDQLQLQEGPQMTATEVERRYELMQRLLGPTLGRLESELLAPLIHRCLSMMARAGVLLPLPPILMEQAEMLGGMAELDVEYEGPLARAAKASDVAAIQRTLEMLVPLAQTDPTVLDNYDLDEMARGIGDANGLASRFKKDPRVVEKTRAERQKKADAEKQQMMQIEQMKAAGATGPLVKAVAPQGLVTPESVAAGGPMAALAGAVPGGA